MTTKTTDKPSGSAPQPTPSERPAVQVPVRREDVIMKKGGYGPVKEAPANPTPPSDPSSPSAPAAPQPKKGA